VYRAAAHGNQKLNVRVKPPQKLRRGIFVGVEVSGFQNYLLSGAGSS
jgi:hypothetical protein